MLVRSPAMVTEQISAETGHALLEEGAGSREEIS